MEAMINKQGLLLKFKQKFQELMKEDEISHIGIDSTKTSSNIGGEVCQSSLIPIPTTSEGKSQLAMSLDVVEEQSKIYGRYKLKPELTSWQKAVNDAAFVLKKCQTICTTDHI